PSSRSWTFASAGKRAAIHVHPAIPQPSVKPSRFIEPTLGVRLAHPNFSAPSSKHSSKWRDENGMSNDSSFFGSLRTRSLTGSILSWSASSFIADSVAYSPGTAPGPRMGVGEPTLRLARPAVTRRLGTLYWNAVDSPQSSW